MLALLLLASGRERSSIVPRVEASQRNVLLSMDEVCVPDAEEKSS